MYSSGAPCLLVPGQRCTISGIIRSGCETTLCTSVTLVYYSWLDCTGIVTARWSCVQDEVACIAHVNGCTGPSGNGQALVYCVNVTQHDMPLYQSEHQLSKELPHVYCWTQLQLPAGRLFAACGHTFHAAACWLGCPLVVGSECSGKSVGLISRELSK